MPNILIIDDSPTMRQLLSYAMKRIPESRVIEATDGVDALQKLSSEKIDIILSDINMPVMDGLKLLSLVRQNNSYRNIPIIIITTESAKEDQKKALTLGANAYLTKPIQSLELITTVTKLTAPL